MSEFPNPLPHGMTEVGRLDAELLDTLLPPTWKPRVQVWRKAASTQQLLLDGSGRLADRSVVITDHQTAGRGRRGRQWLGQPGGMLALSMLAHYPPGMGWPSGLSLALGVAAADWLHEAGIAGVGLKWPNDIQVDGRKLGGILLETFAGGVVAGIGINLHVSRALRSEIAQECVDLAELGSTTHVEALAVGLIRAWNTALDRYFEGGLPAFVDRWYRYDALFGRPVRVLGGAEVVDGIADGIDERGQLLLRVGARKQAFSSGDVSVRLQ